MQNVFDRENLADLTRRLDALPPTCARQWGKMSAAQMLAHCARALETPLGERHERQTLLGRILSPFVRASTFGETPFRRGIPTDAAMVVADERDFFREKQRLAQTLARLCNGGPAAAHGRIHSFFGSLSGEEWGRFVFKHLDHHLRQFGG